MNKDTSKWFNFIKNDMILIKKRPSILFIIILALPLIYFIVYSTGGIKYVYSHSMYILIILAGIYYGITFGVLTGIIAGILLGPLMPLDTLTGEIQEPLNWVYRLLIFMIVGSIIGYASHKFRKDANKIQILLSINQETNIPNTNYLKQMNLPSLNNGFAIYTVLLSNHHNIIDLLGVNIYYEFLHSIYKDLINGLQIGSIVVQSDSNKLWILIPNPHRDENFHLLMKLLNQPKHIHNIPMYADFSIGGSMHFQTKTVLDLTIFEDSDISARHAQINNLPFVLGDKNKYQKRTEYELLAAFSNALVEHQTYLVFQPKININTHEIYGLEALIRWNHPNRGIIPPDQFIPLIEETKLIHLLTDWVLTEALNQCKMLISRGYNIPISINISGKNLYDPKFYERTYRIISDSEVPFELIEFELTESTLMINPNDSRTMLEKFVNLGIKISIDDFGSGYSSLSYLTQFPIHFIKIDRFFLKNIESNASMSEIVKSTITLSKRLGYEVVVEGIETKDVLNLMKTYNCDYAQGYYFAKPMTREQLYEWLKNTPQF